MTKTTADVLNKGTKKGTWTSFLARSETGRLRLHSIQWHNSQSSPAEQ